MEIIWKLLTPFMYLSIRGKKAIDYGIPVACATASVFLFSLLPKYPPIFSEAGLVALGNGFVVFLAGFFIASLAAVMTFDRPGLDEEVVGMPAEILSRQKGNWIRVNLTRRRFLAYLFGYLTALSFLIYFFSSLAQVLRPSIIISFSLTQQLILKSVFCWTYTSLLIAIVTTSFYGLYYLIERVERT